jgi:hypothetical protein
MSYYAPNTQRSIFLWNISTSAKTLFVGVNVYLTSLKHAYTTDPYSRILLTNAVISWILTRTLEIPSILQLHLTALKVRFAAANLTYNNFAGDTTS